MAKTLADLPVDSKVEYLTLWGDPVVWRVIGQNLPDMPSDSTTIFMDKINALLPFDAKEPQNSDASRKSYGNSDWGVSNLRQWANSPASAGDWYSAQHLADAPPTDENVWVHDGIAANPYQDKPGMLYESTQEERDLAIVTTRHYTGYTGNSITSEDKFFPLTSVEVGLQDITGNGIKIPYFVDDNSRVTQCTAQCIAHSNYPNNPTTAAKWNYWMQNSNPVDSYTCRLVNASGLLGNSGPSSGGHGVRLGCNLPSSTRVSDSTNEAGNYTLTFAPPALYLAGDWTGEDGAAPQALAWVPADATHRFYDETGSWSRIEVAPPFAPPEDIADASWEDIAKLADLAAKDPSSYEKHLGQEREFRYGDFDVTARIVGIAQDDRAAGGKVGLTFEIYRGMGAHNMNSSNTTAGGYASSAMKTYIDGLAFPADLQPLLQEFVVHYRDGSNVNTAAKTLNAKAALMSARNMYWPGCQGENGDGSYFWEDEGPTYQYFTNNDTLQARIHYNNSGGAHNAWLLSPYDTAYFMRANPSGYASLSSASGTCMPAVRFCLGSSI